MEIPLLVIIGPTATGKSALAIRLAAQCDGEIVSADSRQVYRYMDIGTAKPSVEDRSTVPHHLIDIIDPDEEHNLVLFQRQARAAIEEIHQRSRLPILVGGTGQYVWGLLEGWQVPEVPPNRDFRRELEGRSRTEGAGALYRELANLDPEAAARIHPSNTRRVIRALEVLDSYDDPAVPLPRTSPPPYRTTVVGLTLERPTLHERIDQRVDSMIDDGWVGEVRRLIEMGYGPELPSLSSLGYHELMLHISSELPLDSAIHEIKRKTHRFARRQYAWFRTSDQRIAWFEASPAGFDAVEKEVEALMERTGGKPST